MTPIEEIKSKIGILDIVAGYVRLERSGAQHKARCPFHHERTPSFYISPERGTYHCFGCQEHGDIFKFVEKIEHIPFVEALKLLADRAGVSLSNYKSRDGDRDSRLIEILTLAKEKYVDNLNSSVEAKIYLLERGLSPFSIQSFAAGYAKSEWRDMFTYLMSKRFTPEEIVESGLVIQTEDGKYYDRFRGRIMFPIHNISNAIVGYTGRVLPAYDDGKSGKYVNTPETAIYHKSNILYNYNRAKKPMAESRQVVLVEGQMDVIMSTQAGINNVIAVSGTAFTDYHVKMIKRLADSVIISFDNDKAGQSARDKAIQMCLSEGLEVFILNPDLFFNKKIEDTKVDIKKELKDAADIVKNNPEDWVKIVNNKVPLFDYLISQALITKDSKEKENYIRQNILYPLFHIASPLSRNNYIQYIASKLSIPETVLKEEMGRLNVNNNLINSSLYVAPKVEEVKSINVYANIELQYIALSKYLKLEIEDEIKSILEMDYPEEMIEGTLLYLQSMGTSVENIVDGKKLDEAGIRDSQRKVYADMHADLVLKIKKNNKAKIIQGLNAKLRVGGLTDEETFSILAEINELKKEHR